MPDKADDIRKALEVLVGYYTADYGKGWFVIQGDIPAYEWEEDKVSIVPAWAAVRQHLGLTAPQEPNANDD